MRISSVALHQFRNIDHIEKVQFSEAPLIVLLAPNASGKTNFLEAVTVLLRGKSFRSSLDSCVMWGEKSFTLQGRVVKNDSESFLSVVYEKERKKINITENNVTVSPVVFFGKYPYVLFLPEDSFLFTKGPVGRRNFINTTLASSRTYLASVVQYHKALKQRNASLKRSHSAEDVVVWTELLVQYAERVWDERILFINYMQSNISRMYFELCGENIEITLQLVLGAPSVESLRQLLLDSWDYEKRYGYTLYGPHRDDIRVTSNGRDVNEVFSRGQMRGLVIAMKVVARAYIEQRIGIKPILLFDEILSELDPGRQQVLLNHLPATQTILTCTSLPDQITSRSDVEVLDVRSLITKINNA